MIPIIWFKRASSSWDTALPRYILERCGCVDLSSIDGAASFEKIAIVIPGQHSTKDSDYDELNRIARMFELVIFYIVGDEEALFRSERLEHPNMKIWWGAPPFHPKQKADRVTIFGWPAGMLVNKQAKRPLDYFFAGQNTHIRRQQCIAAAQKIPNGFTLGTQGFSQGISREQYYKIMGESKVVLCPSGPAMPDSFRFAEALESGCVPIVDNCTPDPTYPKGYWRFALGCDKLPFPVIDSWENLSLVAADCLHYYREIVLQCDAWWLDFKERLVEDMREDLCLA